jgi:single-stranded DNA-binding protein
MNRNTIIIIGEITEGPRLAGRQPQAELRVANPTREYVVRVFGERAAACKARLSAGCLVCVEGRLKPDGHGREIVAAERVTLLRRKEKPV